MTKPLEGSLYHVILPLCSLLVTCYLCHHGNLPPSPFLPLSLIRVYMSWIPWNLSFRYVSFHEKKKTPNNVVTPQTHSQFTPKMKVNAVLHLLSSLVWIDQYNWDVTEWRVSWNSWYELPWWKDLLAHLQLCPASHPWGHYTHLPPFIAHPKFFSSSPFITHICPQPIKRHK